MNIKMFVKLIIVVILLFGAVGSQRLPGNCPEYTKQFCACNGTDKAKILPLKMCYYNPFCAPCPLKLQDQFDCSICPGNKCPICADDEYSLQETLKKKIPDEAPKKLFARSVRKSRDAWEPLPHDAWCKFNRHMLNGQVECTYTTYSKDCLLSCYEPFKVNGQREYSFSCQRKENVWEPELRSCEDTSGDFMSAPVVPGMPEDSQQSMPNAPEQKTKSGNKYNDFHDIKSPVAAGAAPAEGDYIYDSDDDDDDDFTAQSSKGNAASSHVSPSLDDGQINEGVLKDFYDLLNDH